MRPFIFLVGRLRNHKGTSHPLRESPTTVWSIVEKTIEIGIDARSDWSEDNLTASGGRAWDREDFLVHARLVLAVACTVAVCIKPASFGKHADASEVLILVYLTYSVLNLLLLRLSRHYGVAWAICLQATEVVITSLITMFTGGAQSPLLGLNLFVVLAAAFKWGFNGALLTSCACIIFLFADLTLPSSWSRRSPNLMSGGSSFVATMTLSASLVSLACLLGVLVEKEMKRYGDATVITRFLRSAIPDPSFKTALGNTLISVREHFDADQVRLAVQETRGERAVAWEVTRLTQGDERGVRSWELSESLRQACFAMPPEEVRRGLRFGRAGDDTQLGADSVGEGRRGTAVGLASGSRGFSSRAQNRDRFDDLHIVSERHSPFAMSWSLLATSFLFRGKWLGRLTVYNPHKGWDPNRGLRFLEALVRDVGPAIYNKYLVGRLRSRAQSRERVRLVQELHDGVIQSLIGLEMQIDLLRRTQTASSDPTALLQELRRLQSLLHKEIAAVREEMQRIKPLEVEPSRLIEYMARTVDRFRREQGIAASFVAESEEISLTPRVCTELVRIVQEALANVRKHSGAGKVLVSFARGPGHYKLCVEDDGCGFGFAGPMSPEEIEASPKCPLVVTERVRAIGGELMIESSRGSGARLEILVPLTAHGRVSGDS